MPQSHTDRLGFLLSAAFVLVPTIAMTRFVDFRPSGLAPVGLVAYPVPCLFALLAAGLAYLEAVILAKFLGIGTNSPYRITLHVVAGIAMTFALFASYFTFTEFGNWVFEFGRWNLSDSPKRW